MTVKRIFRTCVLFIFYIERFFGELLNQDGQGQTRRNQWQLNSWQPRFGQYIGLPASSMQFFFFFFFKEYRSFKKNHVLLSKSLADKKNFLQIYN